MEIFSIDVVSFSYWTYMTMEILRKNGFFTYNLKTLLCSHFGGSENIILCLCFGVSKTFILDYAKKNVMMALMKKRSYIRTQVVVA